MNINEPARRDSGGDPLIFIAKPRFRILRRLGPGESAEHFGGSLDGVVHDEFALMAPEVFPREPDERVLNHLAVVERWDTLIRRPYARDETVTREELGAILIGHRRKTEWAPWAMCWFSHLTYRFGRDDGEILASFERYVRAAQRHNAKLPEYHPDSISLMGAEDRWRWKLCDCASCSRGPTVAINH